MIDPVEPPNDIGAERKLVGAILLQPTLMPEMMGLVEPSDLAHAPYALMYAAMCDLAVEDSPISVGTVALRVAEYSVDRVAVVAALEGVATGEAAFWAQRVVELRKKRSLLAASVEAQRLALSSEPIDAAFAKVEELLASKQSGRDASTIDMPAGTARMMERLERYIADPDALAGLATGWNKFDRYLDGLRPGGVYTFYADPSGFKSMMVQNIGWRLARDGTPGMWFSTETPWHEVMERLTQFEMQANFREIRRDRKLYEHIDKIRQTAEYVAQYPIWGNDQSSMELGFLRGIVRRMKKLHGIEYVIVDLVDHCYSAKHKGKQVESDEAVMTGLKDMAKCENVAVIVTSHVRKRDRFGDQTKPYIEPTEMRGSSEKQGTSDACISLVLVRKDMNGFYCRLSYEEVVAQKETEGAHTIYAAVTKNRHGETGRVMFRVDLHKGGYMQVEEDNHR